MTANGDIVICLWVCAATYNYAEKLKKVFQFLEMRKIVLLTIEICILKFFEIFKIALFLTVFISGVFSY